MFRGIPMREWQVLLAAALDLPTRETAELMLLSTSSVKGLRNNLRKRMGSTINSAVVRCLHEGDVLSFEDLF
jgi:FixJ family two-component response regulator